MSCLKMMSELTQVLNDHSYNVIKPMLSIGQNTYIEVQHRQHNQFFVCKITESPKIFEIENKILSSISHKNIIKVFEKFQEKQFNFTILEHFMPVSLEKIGVIPKEQIRMYSLQILCALEHCSSYGIYIGNLSPKTIFIDKYGMIKFVDFQHAMLIPKRYCTRFSITTQFPAPEIVQGIPFNLKAADMWSIGIILFYMVNGTYPCKEFTNAEEYMASVENIKSIFQFNEDMLHADILINLFQTDPNIRATLEDVRKVFGLVTIKLQRKSLEVNKTCVEVAIRRRAKVRPVHLNSYAEVKSYFNSV